MAAKINFNLKADSDTTITTRQKDLLHHIAQRAMDGVYLAHTAPGTPGDLGERTQIMGMHQLMLAGMVLQRESLWSRLRFELMRDAVGEDPVEFFYSMNVAAWRAVVTQLLAGRFYTINKDDGWAPVLAPTHEEWLAMEEDDQPYIWLPLSKLFDDGVLAVQKALYRGISS